MSKFSFNNEPRGVERVSVLTRQAIYDSLEEVLVNVGVESERFISAIIAIEDTSLTDTDNSVLATIEINKPIPGNESNRNMQWDYELTYGVQDEYGSLHILFPKKETERAPEISGYYKVFGQDIPQTISGTPQRELSESEASKILFDLYQIKNSHPNS